MIRLGAMPQPWHVTTDKGPEKAKSWGSWKRGRHTE